MTPTPTAPTLRDFADPERFDLRPDDLTLFEEALGSFIPPDAFDAHAHWYDLRHLLPSDLLNSQPPAQPQVGYDRMIASMQRWMGERVIRQGLFFPFPKRGLDCRAANAFLIEQLQAHPQCRGLLMIRPEDDPAEIERLLREHRLSGFKVYHLLAAREDTFQAEQGEFLPDWAWQLADQYGLWITMHMVLPRALSDPRNSRYIVDSCRRYPGARLVLAHAARGFNPRHTIEAIEQVAGLDNVYFDTSAICEASAFEAILRATGSTRLMYGSDFPVSEVRGRPVSVGNGFFWLYQHNASWQNWPHGQLLPVGLESLLALKQACQSLRLSDADVERLFSRNARLLLNA